MVLARVFPARSRIVGCRIICPLEGHRDELQLITCSARYHARWFGRVAVGSIAAAPLLGHIGRANSATTGSRGGRSKPAAAPDLNTCRALRDAAGIDYSYRNSD
jgi:hypothetical protein